MVNVKEQDATLIFPICRSFATLGDNQKRSLAAFLLTTNQKVAGSSPAERAPLSTANNGKTKILMKPPKPVAAVAKS